MMRTNHLLLIGAVALGAYLLGPQVRDRILSPWGHAFGTRLDPGEVSPNVEDRRGERGGGDLGRLGPPPQWGGQEGGGPQPWDQAGGEDNRQPRSGAGGGPRCRDRVTGQYVPMDFCLRQQGGRR